MLLVRFFVSLLRLVTLPLALLRRAFAAPRHGWLALELDSSIVDFTKPRRFRLFFRRETLCLHRVAEAAKHAESDARVRGVIVTLKNARIGMATATSLRRVFAGLRAANKEVVVYLPLGGGSKEVYLGVAGSKLIAGPRSTIAPFGFASHVRYLRGLFDKLDVVPEVYARGRFKSAGEQVARTSMSDTQREQLEALYDTMFDELNGAIRDGRRVSAEAAKALVDDSPHGADAAKAKGLVDEVAYEDSIARIVGAKPGLAPRSLASYAARRVFPRLSPFPPRHVIGVVAVHGPIMHARETSFGRAAEDDAIISAIRAARRNPRVSGVVLSVDSPGGGALASDRIHHELVELAREKPLVCSMSNVAASGGYYVAAACHAIVAEPTTITGSIGVVTARFAMDALFRRFGITTDVVKRGAHADMMGASRPYTAEERAIIERELETFYTGFVGIVAEGRKMSVDAVRAVAEGRVWSGKDALAVGLVDSLGGFEDAVELVRKRVGTSATNAPVVAIRGDKSASSPLAPAALSASVRAALAELFGDALGSTAGLRIDTELLPLFGSGPRLLTLLLEPPGF